VHGHGGKGRGSFRLLSSSSSSSSPPSPSSSSSSSSSSPGQRPLRIISGVQPSGTLHLGNYLGSLTQWPAFQDSPTLYAPPVFSIVDLHAVTSGSYDPSSLRSDTLKTAALYIACGIDPEKSTVFVQSHVRQHAELMWLLGSTAPVGWLERMIQYKEKKAERGKGGGGGGEKTTVGLFSYPVLMAADILLYGGDLVPVGEDQRQHLELTRDLARRFNDQYCRGSGYKRRVADASADAGRRLWTYKDGVFNEPEALVVGEGARVMSLLDGTKKMSKSDPNDGSRINLLDTEEVVRGKVKRCKTDSLPGVTHGDPLRPESTNLVNIYVAVLNDGKGEGDEGYRTRESVLEEVGGMSWGTFKPLLADAIVGCLRPIRERYERVAGEPGYLEGVLEEGRRKAEREAERTLCDVKAAMGFVLMKEEE